MPLKALPTLEQVRTLPLYLRQTVPEAFLDQNGHMNIRHYLGLYDDAGAPFLESIGMELSYFSERRAGIFDLEHHLSYLAECHQDDVVAVYGRAVDRTPKRLHAVWFLVNETREQLSNVFEFVTSHADLNARKTAPFPDDIGAKLDALVEQHRALDWPAPVCGVMRA